MNKVYKLSMAAIAASLVLVNCSSVEDLVGGDDESVSPTFTGQFVDTYVKGLNYTCTGWVDGEDNQLTGTGVTNAQGEFTCNEGDLVEFSVGSYVIGSDHAYNNPIKSPYDMNLGSTTAIINLAQLLQTLDNHTIDGVLTIPENYTGLNNVTIKLDDPDFDALMADALPNVTVLVSEEVAHAHLNASLGIVTIDDLSNFVSGKSITFSGGGESMVATFASDGYYEENSDTHFCSGDWLAISSDTIHTTCANEGAEVTQDDVSTLKFNGKLESGMTVTTPDHGDVAITKIETAVNPDA